jgi:hypothetical protein
MREAIKASMPRTTYFEGWTVDTLQKELPIWVLSLARAKDRREAMIKTLAEAGANAGRRFLQLQQLQAALGPSTWAGTYNSGSSP